MKYTGTQLMESAPVSAAIVRLALPMMAAMLAQAIYNMTDMFFIGQTGDPNMVAAVSLAFPIFMFSQAFGNVFAVGSSSYISRLLGLKNYGEAQNTGSVCFYLSLATGLSITALLLCFRIPVIKLIGASEATFAHTEGYYAIVVRFMPFAVAGVLFSGLLRSVGETGKAMVLQLVGIVLNIILDPIFISVFGWGTGGAAWATAAGQVATFVCGVWYFLKKQSSLSIRLQDNKPNKTMVKEVFFIGVPAGFSVFLMSMSNILSNRTAAGFGDYVVAGFGIQMRITSFFFSLVLALTMGYQPFAGFNYGAKNFERLKKGFRFTLFFSTAVCAAGCMVFLLFGNFFISVFINDAKTVEAGSVMLRTFIIGLFFMGMQLTFMTSYQALGRSLEATLVTLGQQLLFYVPLLYILSGLFGFKGFIFALPLAFALTALLALVLSGSLFRIMRGKQEGVS